MNKACFSRRPAKTEYFDYNVRLFQGFDENILGSKGRASGHFFTVRSILHIIAGHAAHHLDFLSKNYLL